MLCMNRLAASGGEVVYDPEKPPVGFTADEFCRALTGEMGDSMMCVLCATDDYPAIKARCTDDGHRLLAETVKTYIHDGKINLLGAVLSDAMAPGDGGGGLRGSAMSSPPHSKPEEDKFFHRDLAENLPYMCPRTPDVLDTNYPQVSEVFYTLYTLVMAGSVNLPDIDFSDVADSQSEVGGSNENATRPDVGDQFDTPTIGEQISTFEFSKRADRVSQIKHALFLLQRY